MRRPAAATCRRSRRVEAARREANESIERFLHGPLSIHCPVWVGPADLKHAPDISPADLERLGAAVKVERDARAADFAALAAVETKLDNATRAAALLRSGFSIKAAAFGKVGVG